jgi:hypothetical protein
MHAHTRRLRGVALHAWHRALLWYHGNRCDTRSLCQDGLSHTLDTCRETRGRSVQPTFREAFGYPIAQWRTSEAWCLAVPTSYLAPINGDLIGFHRSGVAFPLPDLVIENRAHPSCRVSRVGLLKGVLDGYRLFERQFNWRAMTERTATRRGPIDEANTGHPFIRSRLGA